MGIVRNLTRRKVRTSLTILGIAIGIFAFSVMGSMSEFFHQLVQNSIKFESGHFHIRAKYSSFSVRSVDVNLESKIESIKGVKNAIPISFASTEENASNIVASLGSAYLIGLPPGDTQDLYGALPLKEGRWLKKVDTDSMLVGSLFSQQKNLKMENTFKLADQEFKVVGIISNTQTFVDNTGVVPLETMNLALKAPNQGVPTFAILPKKEEEIKTVTERVRLAFPEVNVTSSSEEKENIAKSLLIFDLIVLSSAVLAAIVGGLATVNTMIVSVNERIREIGIKKAIGASNLDILKEFLLESFLIGFMGGVIGTLLGFGGTFILNNFASQKAGGLTIFLMTPRLFILSVGVAIILGTVAGVLPAVRASRTDIVKALASEG